MPKNPFELAKASAVRMIMKNAVSLDAEKIEQPRRNTTENLTSKKKKQTNSMTSSRKKRRLI